MRASAISAERSQPRSASSRRRIRRSCRIPAGRGLIYDTVGGSGPLTFEQKFSALFSGKVTSSTLGLISIIGLGLGFVIAVSSFLAAVQERRREFGIMSSIGLADEVLYFFLVESAIVFIAAYLVGIVDRSRFLLCGSANEEFVGIGGATPCLRHPPEAGFGRRNDGLRHLELLPCDRRRTETGEKPPRSASGHCPVEGS